MPDPEPQVERTLSLPYDPILSAMKSPDHAKRAIKGILESYNSNYDALAEAVQNSMDALEDAYLTGLPAPYLLHIVVDLKDNTISVFDTGNGMSQEQLCEAFAPTATFKDIPAKIRQRGDKYPYRGYKGVGLTFLAYGTNDVLIQSRQNGSVIKGRMKYGRDWVDGRRSEAPILNIDDSPTPLDATRRRGTYLRLLFSQYTSPQSLLHLGTSLDIWEAILRTRTAVGQILIEEEPATQFKVTLTLVATDGSLSEREVAPIFYYPDQAKRLPAFQFLDIGRYKLEHPDVADVPPAYKRRDGVYIKWGPEEVKARLDSSQLEEFKSQIAAMSPRVYAFRPFDEPTWKLINDSATGQHRAKFLGPGLVIGVNHQRIASEPIRIAASRSEYLASNVFVLVHFDNAALDQGRKALQHRSMELAQLIADDAVQLLLRQGQFLKPAGEKTSAAQRAVEAGHEDWVDNVKEHAKANPLSLPPLCYASTPITEQDVVGLFNQLAALGLFPGLKILATSAAATYDCYARFECDDHIERLRYGGIGNNPLGLSTDAFRPNETHFTTRGLTLEFKNNLEGLIANLDDPASRKAFGHIDICVCWGSLEGSHRWYTLEHVTEENLHIRQFPGVTHVLWRETESKGIQVIILEDIIKMITAGQIVLPGTQDA